MSQEKEKEIESLARDLCQHDGNDPNAIVTKRIIYEKSAAGGGVIRYLPRPEDCFPAWQAYSHLAELVLAYGTYNRPTHE